MLDDAQNEESQVFVDLTSAPREWTTAATSTANFFTNIELYVVKPSRKRRLSDYNRDEVFDRDIPRPEIIRTSRSNLHNWMRASGRLLAKASVVLYGPMSRLSEQEKLNVMG